MQTNRRNWLKQAGLGFAAISMSRFSAYSAPDRNFAAAGINDSLVRLSSNENPYGPSPMARAAMAEYANRSNRYHFDLASRLIDEIAKANGVSPDNILTGAGSTEVIDIVIKLAATKNGNFITADPSYPFWMDTAVNSGLKKIAVPLTSDKKLDLPAMLKAINADTRLVYICNPNNPTGTVCEREALVQFIAEATKTGIVLVDEAYLDFTKQQSLNTIAVSNKNLVIVKTFSKIYGLAGARVGYAIADSKTIDQMARLLSWNNGSTSVVSRVAAIASLKDGKFVQDTYSLNEKTRQYAITQLGRLGMTCIPSSTNFIYFSLANYPRNFFEQLKTNNIAGTGIYEEQGKWTRITVGTMPEMQQFIKAIS